MKLDKIKFGKVLAYISGIVQRNQLDTMDIEILDNLIDVEVPVVETATPVYPKNENVERLMALMAEGKYKIEAIKEHRAITGMGLKESKEAVERYWPNKTEKTFSIADLRSKLNTETWNATSYAVIEAFIANL